VVDQGLLWIALNWAAAALHQADRTYASLEPYLESRNSRFGGGVMRVTPEMQRPASVFWANVQYLMIAVRHLDKALSMLPASAPRLDSDLTAKAVEIRHLLEHWWGAPQNAGAWKGYRQEHGPGAEPTLMEFSPGAQGDLKIGNNPLSCRAGCRYPPGRDRADSDRGSHVDRSQGRATKVQAVGIAESTPPARY
jgi:hypothetical protein